jgi:hypothetical protein
MTMYCRELRGLQPQACGKNSRMSIAAACTLSLPCTRLTCLRGGGGRGRCVAAARARRLVCTKKADRMPIPFRGAHAPAAQGADAACVGGARGGRVSGAHEQPPTVDAATCICLQPSRGRAHCLPAAHCGGITAFFKDNSSMTSAEEG